MLRPLARNAGSVERLWTPSAPSETGIARDGTTVADAHRDGHTCLRIGLVLVEEAQRVVRDPRWAVDFHAVQCDCLHAVTDHRAARTDTWQIKHKIARRATCIHARVSFIFSAPVNLFVFGDAHLFMCPGWEKITQEQHTQRQF